MKMITEAPEPRHVIVSQPFKLKVLTFNIWAVPFVGVSTNERIDAFLANLREDPSRYDVIGIQEAFIPYAVDSLHQELPKMGFEHMVHFVSGADMPSAACGSGCIIASRYPILDTAWHCFTAGGRVYRFDQWDWHAGKGIGLARVLLPGQYGTADVYVSHLQAQYHDNPHDSYGEQRALQALEAAVFIRTTRRSDLTLFLADLNSGPDTLVYKIFSTLAGFKDAYSCTHTKEEALLHGGTLTEMRAQQRSLVSPTYEASRVARSIYDSTFGSDKNVFSGVGTSSPSCDINARLDYILFGTGSVSWPFTVAPFSVTLFHRTWHVLNSDIRLTDLMTLSNGKKINLSDHSAVYAELACVLIAPEEINADSAIKALQSSSLHTDSPKNSEHSLCTCTDPPTGNPLSPSAGSILATSHDSMDSNASAEDQLLIHRSTSHPTFPSHTPTTTIRRSASDGGIDKLGAPSSSAEQILRDALEAAGVPLDRCANLSLEQQAPLPDAASDKIQRHIKTASDIYVSPVSKLMQESHVVPPPAEDSSWKNVLSECSETMQRGLEGVQRLRRTQIIAANVIFAIAMLIAMLVAASPTSNWRPGWALFHSALFAAGFTWAYLFIIKLPTLRAAISAVVMLVSVGVVLGAVVYQQMGILGLLASLGAGLLPLGILHFWVAVMMTSTEVVGYNRAMQQVNVLLNRPPAVVA